MSIGTVWEKSGVTVYKRHNATRSRLYVPNGSNREASFAISFRILRSFFFFHFPSPPVLSSSCRSKVKTHTWPRLSSSRIPKIHARNGQDEKSRGWRSKWSLRLLFASERLFINTTVSKYRSGCQTFHSSTSIRLFFFFFSSRQQSIAPRINSRLTVFLEIYLHIFCIEHQTMIYSYRA